MSGVSVINPKGTLADGRQKDRIENYTKFWQKDIANEGKVDTDNRLDGYTEVVNGERSIYFLHQQFN